MRIMYDSVRPAAIPRNAEMVAGYLPPSRYAWSTQDWARFPKAVKVQIAIFASVNDGHVLDVEPGDATPAEAPGWVTRRRAAGVDPTVYCNLSTWPTVRAEFRRQGVAEPHYWIARYDNHAEMIAGAVAKQYADPATHGRGHYDLSIVADHWPGVDTPTVEDDMTKEDRALLDLIRRITTETQRRVTLDRAEQAGLAKLVAADRDMDPGELQRMLDAAVAKNMAEQRAFLESIVRDVVPDEQAELIVAKIGEKLGGA